MKFLRKVNAKYQATTLKRILQPHAVVGQHSDEVLQALEIWVNGDPKPLAALYKSSPELFTSLPKDGSSKLYRGILVDDRIINILKRGQSLFCKGELESWSSEQRAAEQQVLLLYDTMPTGRYGIVIAKQVPENKRIVSILRLLGPILDYMKRNNLGAQKWTENAIRREKEIVTECILVSRDDVLKAIDLDDHVNVDLFKNEEEVTH